MVSPGWVSRVGLLAVFATVPGDASAAQHTVTKGDTLWAVARANGCSVDAVRKANGLEQGALRVGMKLRIPACAKPAASRRHTVARGDTLSGIGGRYGVSPAAIREANARTGDVIRVGEVLSIPAAGATPEPDPVRMIAGQSVGAPQKGKLADGVQLPHDRSYYRRRLSRTYAAAHVVDMVTDAVESVREAHPKIHRLAIGDLSDKDGGFISGHNSHQSGRDVDLGLYFDKRPAGYPKAFAAAKSGTLHLGAMWTLINALYGQSKSDGGPTKVFLDYRIQKQIYLHARKQKVSKAKLAKMLQYPDGKWATGRLVQHIRNHHDHVHVRYGCPPKDDGCRGG